MYYRRTVICTKFYDENDKKLLRFQCNSSINIVRDGNSQNVRVNARAFILWTALKHIVFICIFPFKANTFLTQLYFVCLYSIYRNCIIASQKINSDGRKNMNGNLMKNNERIKVEAERFFTGNGGSGDKNVEYAKNMFNQQAIQPCYF